MSSKTKTRYTFIGNQQLYLQFYSLLYTSKFTPSTSAIKKFTMRFTCFSRFDTPINTPANHFAVCDMSAACSVVQLSISGTSYRVDPLHGSTGWPKAMMGHGWQRIRTSTQRLAFVLEISHHQHVKPPPRATHRFAFVLENPHHQLVKPSPPAPCRHAFVVEIPHHQHGKPPPPASHRLAFVLENPHIPVCWYHHGATIDGVRFNRTKPAEGME